MSFSLRVAIADEDPTVRESLRQMLQDLGHEVVAVAEDGESLVNQCAKTNPDVVITGSLTSAMNGSDAAAVVYENRPIPIILCSRHCEPDLVRNAEHKHVFMCLVKPICQDDLQTALRECRPAESDELSDGVGNVVPDGAASGSFGSQPAHQPGRPPYRPSPR